MSALTFPKVRFFLGVFRTLDILVSRSRKNPKVVSMWTSFIGIVLLACEFLILKAADFFFFFSFFPQHDMAVIQHLLRSV